MALLAPASPAVRGHVSRLELSAFRNYAHWRCTIEPEPVVITGPNGVGKTNLLEALSLFAPGRGFRGASMLELGQKDADQPWAVAVHLDGPQGRIQVGTGLAPEGGSEKRLWRCDGKTVRSQAYLSEVLQVIWLTPDMDSLFRDSPETRRRFLDRFACVVDSSHSKRLYRYQHALRERATLLKSGRLQTLWLDTLEETMAQEAVALTITRWQTVRLLMEAMTDSLGIFPQGILSLSGWVEEAVLREAAIQVEERLRAQLAASRAHDMEVGGARYGPHRGDLEVTYTEKNMPANQCSTGEQKALLISIVLAFARMQKRGQQGVCLLLLDDVVAHLDAGRREALLAEICHLSLQTWMTGTDEDAFLPLKNQAQFLSLTPH